MKFNRGYIIIGPPQHGKSTVVRGIVMEHLRAHPNGIALVHDKNRQFRKICARYETIAEYRAASAKAVAEKSTTFPHGASFGCSSTEVAQLAYDIGREHNDMDNVRVPIVLANDETSLMETSGPTHIAKIDLEINANRAHLGICPIYNVQRPTALTEAFYSMATDVIIFSQPSPRRTATLEELLGLRDGTLDEIVGWPKYKHKHWKQGEGLV